MASSINASTSGAGGLISTADSSGVLNIQTAGTTAIAIDASQAVTLTNALPVASGGTGAATLTANNVLLGNGTSAVQAVAPSTSGNALVSNGTTWTSGKQTITSGTAVASTSGTSIDFTGIPSWVKRITIMLDQVSTNSTSLVMVQLGDSGGIETSGYSGGAYGTGAAAIGNVTNSIGFYLRNGEAPSLAYCANIMLCNISGNTWIESHTQGSSDGNNGGGGGSKTLSGTLDRIRITTAGGTATFDAGSINILYE